MHGFGFPVGTLLFFIFDLENEEMQNAIPIFFLFFFFFFFFFFAKVVDINSPKGIIG